MHRFYFFFSSRRRHTRLQGDWSSDVCSSDLSFLGLHCTSNEPRGTSNATRAIRRSESILFVLESSPPQTPRLSRSEERRVGKECRSRWAQYHSEKERDSVALEQ